MKYVKLWVLLFISQVGMAQNLDANRSDVIITPIPLDNVFMSGIDLAPVTNSKEPDRQLFQRRLYYGPELSVYVVSSESASAFHESYGIDEVIYLINGGAKLKSKGQEESQSFFTGDFFVAPKGFNGDWETIGANQFHHELSIISTSRNENEVPENLTSPIAFDKEVISGIKSDLIVPDVMQTEHVMYKGHEVTAVHIAQKSVSDQEYVCYKEQVIYIISGALNLIDASGINHKFYAGDFFILPAGFTGKWESYGHDHMRYISLTKSEWE